MKDKENFEQGYKKYESKAKEYMDDKEKADDLLKKAMGKAKDKKSALGEVWEKLQLLFEIFRAWIKGEYKEIPKGSIIMIIATIIYFVSPVDLVPDFIAGLGLLDDAAVIGFAIKQISGDLEKFKVWKETNNQG
ncbi:YkvA family protein [Bacillus massilinigeriensis]|uniref:YkvA family protein n=1 Tax=Bacillus massilionigeriensis TaxID=1805475 RepID=UPI00096B2909|nr:YkvA family protein [Bacillus massilionigeriensis]